MDNNQMNTNNGNTPLDVRGIDLKPKSTNLIIGIFMLAFGGIMELSLLSADMDNKIIALIIANVIFILPIMFYGYGYVACHFQYKKAINAAFEKYGEANILDNMSRSTIILHKEYKTNKLLFFTDKFIIQPKTAIFTYDEISWMYKSETTTKYGTYPSLTFEMLDGRVYSFCKYINDDEINNYMNFCYGLNQNIIFGHSDENQKIQRSREEEWKMRNGK